ncbi:MAG: hypothetical protein JWL80_222 [Parcubacteria group bacterium]|nr:hypothetical protein [Parcubacteria group bacterium]
MAKFTGCLGRCSNGFVQIKNPSILSPGIMQLSILISDKHSSHDSIRTGIEGQSYVRDRD